MQPIKKEYIKSIDALRVIAILAVVAIHISTRTLEASHYDIYKFSFSLFINQIVRFAVPLFFLVSGFVLELNYNHHENFLSYLKRRFSKIFIPYLFWSLVYYYFIYSPNSDNMVKMLFNGSASYQLYFIPTICLFYLIFPLLHKMYGYLSNKYLFLGLFSVQIYLLYHDYFIKEFDFSDPIRTSILNFFIFIFGMVAAHNKDKIINFVKKWKYILTPSAVFAGIYVFWEGRFDYIKTSDYISFYSQWRPSVLIYTILLFGILFYLFEKSKLQFKFIEKLSKLSYFVFFVHVIILETYWKYIGIYIYKFPLSDVLFFTGVSGSAFLVAFIFHKIPRLYKLTG